VRSYLFGFLVVLLVVTVTACVGNDTDRDIDFYLFDSTDVDTRIPLRSDILVSTKLHWQGRMQEITLYSDGLLTSDSAIGMVELEDHPVYSQRKYFEFVKNSAHIEVVDLGSSDFKQALLVSIPGLPDQEDPPASQQLFVSRGKVLHRALHYFADHHGSNALSFPGDGTIKYQENGWDVCYGVAHTEVVDRNIVTLGFVDRKLTKISHQPSGQLQRCDQLAACPYVYRIVDGREEFIGEILRNVIGKEAYTTQQLALPTDHGLVHIQLREEKKEVTYLDSISLVVDGEEILPRICNEFTDLGYCRTDKEYHHLTEGDVLDFQFDVPKSARTLELSATGYYIPIAKPESVSFTQ